MKKTITIVLSVLLVVLILFSIISIAYYFYYFKNNKKKVINTLYGTNLSYVDPQFDKNYPIEVKFYSNENRNGKYCFELNFNFYTDTEIPENNEYKNVYSAGLQITSPPALYLTEYEKGSIFDRNHYNCYAFNNNVNFYNTSVANNVSYSAIKELPSFNGLIFDTDKKLFVMEERGEEDSIYVGHSGLWSEVYFYNNLASFVKYLCEATTSLKEGKHVLQFDISKYFKCSFVVKNGTAISTDTGNEKIDFTIFNIKVEKSSNGLIDSSQSLFGLYNDNPNFEIDKTNKDFYNISNLYHINEYSFDLTKDLNGSDYMYLISLKDEVISFLNKYTDLSFVIEINLDSNYFYNKCCIGFKENAFKDFNFDKCTISSKTQTIFNLNNNVGNFKFNNVSVVGGI